jgi:Molybdopterin oxidoreductase Fe4S4 domain
MSDPIADPWGERTPFGAGGAWPVRVDQRLLDGVAEQDGDQWVPSACVLCSNGCGLDVAVKDGRMVGVRGRATDRVNHGRQPPAGILLLRDLRTLYLMAQECEIDWVMVGQGAKAARDKELLETVTQCVQVKWLTTRIREASPQTLTVG